MDKNDDPYSVAYAEYYWDGNIWVNLFMLGIVLTTSASLYWFREVVVKQY